MRVTCEVEVSDGSTVTALDMEVDGATLWKNLENLFRTLIEAERLTKQLLEANGES